MVKFVSAILSFGAGSNVVKAADSGGLAMIDSSVDNWFHRGRIIKNIIKLKGGQFVAC